MDVSDASEYFTRLTHLPLDKWPVQSFPIEDEDSLIYTVNTIAADPPAMQVRAPAAPVLTLTG